ncbi:MAG: hypothetical protein OHK0023_00670 [Anaerolineae bacterium]
MSKQHRAAVRAKQAQQQKQPQSAFMMLGIGVAMIVVALLASGMLGGRNNGPADQAAVAGSLISPAQYKAQFEDNRDHILLDVRTPEEYAAGHIRGATLLPLQELEARLAELPKDKPVVIYCRSGNRSAQAFQILKAAGYTNLYDLGGIISWQGAGYPISQ